MNEKFLKELILTIKSGLIFDTKYEKIKMKKYFLSILLLGLIFTAKSQTASVAKSINDIQVGFLGTWFHNETKLTNQTVLRSELGLDSSIFGGSLYNGSGFVMYPVITLEPRWYYNFDKRISQSKDISNNSANYISLKTSYNPDWFVISNYDAINVISHFSIIPTWGIKRNLGEHFEYEMGLGFGYRHLFLKREGFSKDTSEFTRNIQLRIGYRF